VAGMDTVRDRIDQETGEILKASALAPDQVLSYFLSARQQSQWEKFFLYLDLESLYRNFHGSTGFRNMSEAQRIETLKKFRNDLKNELIDNDIIVIPSNFEIVKTTYTANEGTVEVIQKYNYAGYREVKLFVYHIARKDSVGNMYNYEVQNRGTESLR
jgi:hypothetical protein